MPMIEVEHLTRHFGSTKAIEDVSFSVEKGQIVGFLGPNGAGKTTTMRVLTGAIGATEGRALIGGIDVFEKPRAVKRMIGYLPEVPPLYGDMTVRSYLRYCARIRGASRPREAVERVIDQVGLRKVAHRLVDHLSKGFKQRVGIAQALVHSPQVLILDEPTSGLDPAQRKEIRDLIVELARGEVTVVLSTHVLGEVEHVCSRVVIIHNGRIVAQDAISALEGAGSSVSLVVARPGPDLLVRLQGLDGVASVEENAGHYTIRATRDVREEVARASVDAGLLELGSERRLEDVFLQLTAEA
jgi:ABC-2 type transport system ATP-binding protein